MKLVTDESLLKLMARVNKLFSTKSELEKGLLDKSDKNHNHDDRYYTETEMNSKLATKSNIGHTHQAEDVNAKDIDWLPDWEDVQNKPFTFEPTLGTTSTTAFRGDRGKIAYEHTFEAHAPSNAQKNSDITKAEIETKLTGDISSHRHDGRYYTEAEVDVKLSNKADVVHTHTPEEIGVIEPKWENITGKPNTFLPIIGDTANTAFRGDHGSEAYSHSQELHAPSDAQKNSDITKEEIEAKLLGTVTSHNHDNQYYSSNTIDIKLADKAEKDHNHEGDYINPEQLSTELAKKSNLNHGHSAQDVNARPADWVPEWSEVNNKPSTFPAILGISSASAFRGDYGNIAYNHSLTTHAPSNAQKNSDITKAEIEAKLTGNVTTHTHDNRYYTESEVDEKLSNKSDTTHNHDELYINDVTLTQRLAEKANVKHSHTADEIGGEITVSANWDDVIGKPTTFPPNIGITSTTAFRGDQGNIAYNHSLSDHAPSDAQKNSDITKEEIENVLLGNNIGSHYHDGRYYTESEIDNKLDAKSDIGHGHDYVPLKSVNSVTVHADSDANASGEYFMIKSGHNELKVISSGGGEVVTKDNNNLTFNDHIIYHTGKKPNAIDVGARPSNWVPDWSDITGIPNSFSPIIGTSSTTAFRGDYGNIAYNHSQSTHAPVEAQKNSDITKAEIEAKLTGNISTHTHDNRYYTESEIDNKLSEKSDVGHTHDAFDIDAMPRNPVKINASSDLNTFYDSNLYTSDSDGNSMTILNRPPGNQGFILEVYCLFGQGVSGRQIQIAYVRDGKSYIRNKTENADWSAWFTIYSSNNKPTAEDIGARSDSWNPSWDEVTGKPTTFNPLLGTLATTAFRGDYGNIAYNHSLSTHAPGDAQKNSDITKAEIEAKLTGNTINTHYHDGRYYTESETDTLLRNKADLVHGNHVPAVQTANNAKFLRNDNSWQFVTAENIGARPSSWVPSWTEVTGKPSSFTPTLGTTSTTAFRGDYGNIAYNHSQSTHAPVNAQKNSDITKAEIEAKLTGGVTTHNHNGQYYTEAEVDNLISSRAPVSHGIHVPTPQAANNTKFLRNDNTWQSVSPANIGAVGGPLMSGTTTAAAGWYRIAQTTSTDQSNTIGIFQIRAAVSDEHSSTILNAGITYGRSPLIQQFSHTMYSASGITQARIVYHTTYNGKRAYLEVYNPTATAKSLTIQLIGNMGWELTPITAIGSVPTGYITQSITFNANGIVTNVYGKVNGCTLTYENGDFYLSD